MRINPASLNFGKIAATAAFRWTLTIENAGADTVTLASISTSCGCSLPENVDFPLTLIPGENRPFDLEMDLRGPPNSDGAPRPFSVTVFADTSAGRAGAWLVAGLVEDMFWFETPQKLELVSVAGIAPENAISQILRYKPSIRSISVLCDLPGVVATLTDQAPSRASLHIEGDPLVETGTRDGKLVFRGTSLDGSSVSSELPFKRVSLPEIVVMPEFHSLGALAIGNESTFELAIQSRLGRSLTNICAEVVDSVGIHATSKITVDRLSLVVTATSKGNNWFRLKISAQEEGGETIHACVEFHGFGSAQG